MGFSMSIKCKSRSHAEALEKWMKKNVIMPSTITEIGHDPRIFVNPPYCPNPGSFVGWHCNGTAPSSLAYDYYCRVIRAMADGIGSKHIYLDEEKIPLSDVADTPISDRPKDVFIKIILKFYKKTVIKAFEAAVQTLKERAATMPKE